MKKFIIQTGICVVLGAVLNIACHTDNIKVRNTVNIADNMLRNEFTKTDIKSAGEEAIESLRNIPEEVMTLNQKMTFDMTYGDPIDKEFDGVRTTVHAVAGGVVREFGNNDEYGQYIIVQHGNTSESVYGNLASINCELNERVRKGEIIAEYEISGEKNFYYTMNYFD